MKIKWKGVVLLFMLMAAASILFTACSGNSKVENESKGQASDNNNEMSEKVTITLSSTGWLNLPRGNEDPMNRWINETFNVDFKYQTVAFGDLENKLSLEFSSNNPPDIVLFPNKMQLVKFYNEGVLLDDWTPYLDKVPSITNLFNEQSIEAASYNGKMVGLPKAPREHSFSYMIRRDWLNNLGLEVPKTDQELLDVIRKFTFDDPDGNGQDDTWGISSTGSSKGLGSVYILANMYGPAGFYIDDNNRANHSILDGNHLKFLNFLKTLVDEKLIDPDWYTQGASQRKPKVFSGAYGMDWDEVGDFFSSMRQYTGGEVDPLEVWELMPIPVAGDGGGKRPARDIYSGLYAVSKKAAEDPVKMERILKILEAVTYPNDGYFKLRWGVDLIDGNELIDVGNGWYLCTDGETNCEGRMQQPGWLDWGAWIAVKDNVSYSAVLNDDALKEIEIYTDAENQPVVQNISQAVDFDPQLSMNSTQIQNEFEINYILGNNTDYEAFKESWLKAGGQGMLDQMTEQLDLAQ